MPGKGKAVGSIIKWGVKYGPHAIVLAQFSMARAASRVRQCSTFRSPGSHAAGTSRTSAPASTRRRASSGKRRS